MEPRIEQTAETAADLPWAAQVTHLYEGLREYADDAVSFKNHEDLHQARVLNRKLSTLLQALDSAETLPLLVTLKRSRKLLGRVRDRDVLIEAFKARRKALPDKSGRRTLKRFIRFQQEERKAHRRKLKKKLPKLIHKRLEARWSAFLASGSADTFGGRADVYLTKLEDAFDAGRIRYEQLKQELGPSHPDTLEALHRVRLRVKEIRYVLKAIEATGKIDHAHKLSYYEELQEQLGAINDLRHWLDAWTSVSAKTLNADPAAYDRQKAQLAGELAQALGRLNIRKPAETG